jgi:hypothetical protein
MAMIVPRLRKTHAPLRRFVIVLLSRNAVCRNGFMDAGERVRRADSIAQCAPNVYEPTFDETSAKPYFELRLAQKLNGFAPEGRWTA